MSDEDCTAFLQWALPQLDFHWSGFRKVRRQVCKRLKARMRELGISSFAAYRKHVSNHSDEWPLIDSCCHITISRFFRDREIFGVLSHTILPEAAEWAAAERRDVRCWSAGCASGEEVYSLKIAWARHVRARAPEVPFSIVGTDADEAVLQRAKIGCYERSTLRELPTAWIEDCFVFDGQTYCIKQEFRDGVRFLLQDIRVALPPGKFDIVLCRNLVFTYFTPSLQNKVLDRITARLRPGGVIVLGAHEQLPQRAIGFRQLSQCRQAFRWMPNRTE